MRFVAVSDTHGCHRQLDLPRGDVFLHAGDICDRGNREHAIDFFRWVDEIDFEYKVMVWGNHDFDFETGETVLPTSADGHDDLANKINLLNESSIQIGGTTIFGVSTTASKRSENWEGIPDGTDILVTHRPPRGILDKTPVRGQQGSGRLAKRIREVRPRVHLFGHIHRGYGTTVIGETKFINASLYRSSAKRLVNPPVVFDCE